MKHLTLTLWSFFLLPCSGALPPTVYVDLQAEAPEAVEILVKQVKHQNLFRKREMVRAVVTKVVRTSSGLKVGDVIEIRYRHSPHKKIPGPAPVPRLGKGKTYPAWLRKGKGGIYFPAARGWSFAKFWLDLPASHSSS